MCSESEFKQMRDQQMNLQTQAAFLPLLCELPARAVCRLLLTLLCLPALHHTHFYVASEGHCFLLQLLFLSSFLHFFGISFIDNNSYWKTWFFLHLGADILKMQFPALLENHQSSRIKWYGLLMKKGDWAQPNSNPGSNKYDGICIVDCRTRDYSENQGRSSNHQESQNIFFTAIFVTQQLHLILDFYCSTIIFFYLSS